MVREHLGKTAKGGAANFVPVQSSTVTALGDLVDLRLTSRLR